MASTDDCRIAVLIDRCEGALSHLIDEEMVRYITTLPYVDWCDQDENLSDPQQFENLIRGLAEKKADRLVIVGASPKIYERSFRRLSVAEPIHVSGGQCS
jgi:heterodisulfide reductase subunit A-like polyferredoxin